MICSYPCPVGEGAPLVHHQKGSDGEEGYGNCCDLGVVDPCLGYHKDLGDQEEQVDLMGEVLP